MPQITLNQMTKNRRPKIGTMVVEFDSPGLGKILKAAGLDFAFLDMEHSGFDFGSLKRSLAYMDAADLPALVRVPSNKYDHIARALDIGAEGIMVPMVGSADEARHIVNCMKYPPAGGRGVALQISHDRFAPGPVPKKLRDANRKTTFFALIETEEGAENADKIAGLRGVDCLWIGHFDLTCSLGIPGDFAHPKFRKATARIVAAAKKHNKSLARLVPDVKTGVALYKQGFDIICYSGDVWVLFEGMRAGVSALRAKCKGRARK